MEHKRSCSQLIFAAGNESQAVVEFAPFQKIPSEKKKADARNATIDKGAVGSAAKFLIMLK
jgi:hypothetical protein